jgi:hypothetical protein
MCDGRFDRDHLRLSLWNNPTDDLSLSLSLYGYKFVVQELKLRQYTFELTKSLTNGNILQLERHFPSMYFILNQRKKITVFEEQEATMLALYGGDLHSYLNSLDEK